MQVPCVCLWTYTLLFHLPVEYLVFDCLILCVCLPLQFCLRKFTTVNGGRDVTVRGPDGCHMADTLAAIYRHSSMKRRQRLPAEIAAVQSQHVGNTGNGQSISPVPAKRRQADPTYLKVSLQQSPTTSKVDVTRKPPSPYPPSPAIIERILPYCVVVFVLLVISIVFLLFYLTL